MSILKKLTLFILTVTIIICSIFTVQASPETPPLDLQSTPIDDNYVYFGSNIKQASAGYSLLLTPQTTIKHKSTMNINETLKLSPEGEKYFWTVSNTDLATIDTEGNLTAKKTGTVTVYANPNILTPYVEYNIEIIQPISRIVISGDNTLKENETLSLTAYTEPFNATNSNVIWESSNSSIATIDNNGKVVAKTEGKTTISCTSEDTGKTLAYKEITVQPLKPLGEKIADYANTWVGKTQYVWGGNNLETGVDCSGFICAIYEKFGYNLWYARTNLDIVGYQVSLSEAKPGDIVSYPGHVALYIGNGMVTHAADSNFDIVTTPIDWSGQHTSIVRVI